MIEGVPEGREGEAAEGGEDAYGGDQDAEPSAAPEQVDEDSGRDQAET